MSCLVSEYSNIILDDSGDILNHADITVMIELTRYHTYCVKEKRDKDYKKFDDYGFIIKIPDCDQSGDWSYAGNAASRNSKQSISSAVIRPSRHHKSYLKQLDDKYSQMNVIRLTIRR